MVSRIEFTLLTLNDDDFLADDDFDKIFIEYIWKSYSLFINDEEEEEQQQQAIMVVAVVVVGINFIMI